MDMLMVNAVSTEAAAMPAGGADTSNQTTEGPTFGQVLDAELGQSTVGESDVQVAEPAKAEEEVQGAASDGSAAVAMLLAQFAAMDSKAIPVTDLTSTTAAETVPLVQPTDGRQAPASPNVATPVATDGGPYVVGTPAVKTDSPAAESVNSAVPDLEVSDQETVVAPETNGAVEVDISALDLEPAGVRVQVTQAEPEAIPVQLQTSADTGRQVDASGQQLVGNPMVGDDAVVQENPAQVMASDKPQEQANQAQPSQAQVTTNAVGTSQAAQQAQPDPFASAVTASETSNASSVTEAKAASSDNTAAKPADTAMANTIAGDSRVTVTSKDSADSNPDGQNPAFAFAGQDQVQASSADTVRAATSNGNTEAYAEVHQRVIDSVVREVKLRRFDQGGEIVMRLDPPELGTMRIRLTQVAGMMTGHISASSDQVKSMLQAHLPALVDAMGEAGIKMDSVSVSTGMPSGAFAHDGAGNSAQEQFRGSRRQPSFAGTSSNVGVLAAMTGAAATNSNAGYSWLA